MKDIFKILILVASCLFLLVNGNDDETNKRRIEISPRNIRIFRENLTVIDLNLRTGQPCVCVWPRDSVWNEWSSCEPRTAHSCFDSIQYRRRECRSECYRIQVRACRPAKSSNCHGKWGRWLAKRACSQNVRTAEMIRFCYSVDGTIGSFCNKSRDEFYQEKNETCKTPSSDHKSSQGNDKPGWISWSHKNLLLIILAVLAGVFLVALIFVSVLFAALRKSVLKNGGRGSSDSTASATSCVTTIPDKESSFNGGSVKYHQVKKSHLRSPSNGSRMVKMNENEVFIINSYEGRETVKSPLGKDLMTQRNYGADERLEFSKRDSSGPPIVVTSLKKDKRSSTASKKSLRNNDKVYANEINSTTLPSSKGIQENQRNKNDNFQSLPHIRRGDSTEKTEKRKSKVFRFSGGKSDKTEAEKKPVERRPRNRTKSGNEIVFSGWDNTSEHAPPDEKPSDLQDVNVAEDTANKSKRPVSNTFLFSTTAANSLKKASVPKPPPKHNGFKLDQNILMKKAVVGNTRGRAGFDDRQLRGSDNSLDDSGGYSHLNVDPKAYASVLDAKPIEADAISNGSAYADVWDADYSSKPKPEYEDEDYSEVFDAKKKSIAFQRGYALERVDSPTRQLPRIGRSRSPKMSPVSREIPPSLPIRETSRSVLDDKTNEIMTEPIYCAI